MRVGDRDRELAASALRKHYVSGRLSTDELEQRVGMSLQAQSRRDLNKAMRGLPLVWDDVRIPQGVQRSAQRMRRLLRLVRSWFKVNVLLAAALAIALLVGAPIAETVGAALLAWSIATYAFWRVWLRG